MFPSIIFKSSVLREKTSIDRLTQSPSVNHFLRMTMILLKTQTTEYFFPFSFKETHATEKADCSNKPLIQQFGVISVFLRLYGSRTCCFLIPLLRDPSLRTYFSYQLILSFYRQFHFYSVRLMIKYPCVTLYLYCTCPASCNNIGFYEVSSRSMCQNSRSVKNEQSTI